MFTRHGHHIKGTPVEGTSGPVARCGGPMICKECAVDAADAQSKIESVVEKGNYRIKTPPVQAREVTNETAEDIAKWCGGTLVQEEHPLDDEIDLGINVPGPHGLRASKGDYVVKNGDDLFLVFGPNRFKTMFEPI